MMGLGFGINEMEPYYSPLMREGGTFFVEESGTFFFGIGCWTLLYPLQSV